MNVFVDFDTNALNQSLEQTPQVSTNECGNEDTTSVIPKYILTRNFCPKGYRLPENEEECGCGFENQAIGDCSWAAGLNSSKCFLWEQLELLCWRPDGVVKTWWDTAIVCVIEDDLWVQNDNTNSNLPSWELSNVSRCTIE